MSKSKPPRAARLRDRVTVGKRGKVRYTVVAIVSSSQNLPPHAAPPTACLGKRLPSKRTGYAKLKRVELSRLVVVAKRKS